MAVTEAAMAEAARAREVAARARVEEARVVVMVVAEMAEDSAVHRADAAGMVVDGVEGAAQRGPRR